MARLLVFSCRQDETGCFEACAQKYGVEIVTRKDAPSLANAGLVKGFDGVVIVTTPIPGELLRAWKELGVKALSTRTVGFEHIDVQEASRLGMPVFNVSYTPHTVAEFTVMSMLMVLRKVKLILERFHGQDFALKATRGRELGRCAVGIVGTGAIGCEVAKLVHAFGCKVLCCSPHVKEEIASFAKYVSLEELLSSCDVVSLHVPSTGQTKGMIGREQIGLMKRGSVLVNMARGAIVDTAALIDALESGKLGGAALDFVDGDAKVYYRDLKGKTLSFRELAVLRAMPNVLLTPHVAFFSDEAVGDMVEFSVRSIVHALNGEDDPYRIN